MLSVFNNLIKIDATHSQQMNSEKPTACIYIVLKDYEVVALLIDVQVIYQKLNRGVYRYHYRSKLVPQSHMNHKENLLSHPL